jgi:hypothetical protein
MDRVEYLIPAERLSALLSRAECIFANDIISGRATLGPDARWLGRAREATDKRQMPFPQRQFAVPGRQRMFVSPAQRTASSVTSHEGLPPANCPSLGASRHRTRDFCGLAAPGTWMSPTALASKPCQCVGSMVASPMSSGWQGMTMTGRAVVPKHPLNNLPVWDSSEKHVRWALAETAGPATSHPDRIASALVWTTSSHRRLRPRNKELSASEVADRALIALREPCGGRASPAADNRGAYLCCRLRVAPFAGDVVR